MKTNECPTDDTEDDIFNLKETFFGRSGGLGDADLSQQNVTTGSESSNTTSSEDDMQ